MTPYMAAHFVTAPVTTPLHPVTFSRLWERSVTTPVTTPVTLFGPVLLCKPLVCNGCNDVTYVQILDGRCR